MALAANKSVNVLVEVFGERISQELWPAHSPDLNPCDFYFWDTLKIKCM
jgi:hypothetical protein